MKTKLNLLVAGIFLAAPSSALATVHYVNVNNTNPTPPYTNWATAATDIQSAVNAAGAGDEILVTNGTYAPVGVGTPLMLQSVNGPDLTVIDGGGASGCLYLANNAVMVGFTLTNGAATYGGGVYGGTLNNCTLTSNHAIGLWGWGWHDIGYYSAGSGGGANSCTLNNCTLTGNSSTDFGGGANSCTLNNCTLTGNSSAPGWGAGVYFYENGGGASFCTLNNCTLSGNAATTGGGAYESTLNNCTLTGNSAYGSTWMYGSGGTGGGAFACTLNNCIAYFNSAQTERNYDSSSILNYCCTTPMPPSGVGNISMDPQLASASYLSPYSPCIGGGSAAYVSGTDIDGEPWANPPSIGCDEYHAGAVTGPMTVSLTATYRNVATDFPVGLTAFIAGRTDLSVWDFGDGYVEVNEPYTSHSWAAPGDYLVALWAFNDSYPCGVSATVTVHVVEELHYVAGTSGNPVAPYTSWATAATNIQDAVDVASAPGATILVTNGTYAAGGQVDPNGNFDLVVVDGPLTIRSVNGPGVTVINGGGAATCVYLGTNAVLAGFTLTNGVATNIWGGGGVYCEDASSVLTNCVLTGNSVAVFYDEYGDLEYGAGGGAYGGTLNHCTLAGNSGAYYTFAPGGGAYGSTLNDCTLTGNSAAGYGGGAYDCTLNNCTLAGNSVLFCDGGGAYDSTLNNCIVYFNSDPYGGNYDSSSTLNYCCTTPMPTSGAGNVTNTPLFVNYAAGDLRLLGTSPCINAGNNAYVTTTTDLAGNPRIVGGTVDMGAYEYQTPVSMISYAWLQQYGLPINTNTDTADLDGTGMNVYQDWVAGLNPTNALSVLKLTSATKTNNPAGLVVTWESVNTRTYYLQRSTNLAAQPVFYTIQSNIVGQAGTTSYTDTTAMNAGPYFYRVGVGN